jgi:hypothetical protein
MGAVFWWSEPLDQSTEQSASDANAKNQDIEQLKKEIEYLRLELRHVSNEMRFKAFKNQEATNDEKNSNDEESSEDGDSENDFSPPSQEMKAALIEEKVTKRQALLDEVMDNEAVDIDWGRQMEEQVNDMIDSELLSNSEMLQFKCRSTICKMRFLHRSVEAFEKMPEALDRIDHRYAFVHGEPYESENEMYTTIYFSRVGHELPK